MRQKIEAHVTYQERGDARQWKVGCCPFCKEEHFHGAGGADQDPKDFLGHRSAHCVSPSKEAEEGYMLVEDSK